MDAAIRRAVALELLPDDPAADRKLVRLLVDERVRDKKSGRGEPASTLGGRVLDALLTVSEASFDGDQDHAGSPQGFEPIEHLIIDVAKKQPAVDQAVTL